MEEQIKQKKEGEVKDKAPAKQGTKTETPKKDSHTLKCEQLAKEYGKSYPNETEFHITSDYQVFLGGNRSHAQNHQRTQKSGEIVTIKVK